MANKRSPWLAFWLLERLNDSHYDGYYAFVVRAGSSASARLLADGHGTPGPRNVWTDPAIATCRRLDLAGRPVVILAGGDELA